MIFNAAGTGYHVCYTADGGTTWGVSGPGTNRILIRTDCGQAGDSYRVVLRSPGSTCADELSAGVQRSCTAWLACGCPND
ncbi:MAG: hypothetical protein CMJ84_12500 [Planctomycetes bacterium]|jgi:hypothetical protein|nr:hypothetical protein [Planctomycetota bacterium]MDP6409461.1 hypothetical protein [Planctomycetota bacterium]